MSSCACCKVDYGKPSLVAVSNSWKSIHFKDASFLELNESYKIMAGTAEKHGPAAGCAGAKPTPTHGKKRTDLIQAGRGR